MTLRIAVIGNCHGDIIAKAARVALQGAGPLDCRHIVSYASATEDGRDFIDLADRVLLQVTDFKALNSLATGLDVNSQRVGTFPLIACNFLYPYAGRAHPLAAGTRSAYCPSGYYEGQLSDGMLIEVMGRHPAGATDAAVSDYLALDYAKLLDLDRLYEMNRTKLQRIGAASKLDLWPKIERRFRDVPVFWTYLHPNGELLRDLTTHALQQLDLGLPDAAVKSGAASIKEPLGFAHMPVHPSVARHFGIEWATLDHRYRLMPEGRFTSREFASRYIRFEHNDSLTHAVHGVHANIGLDAAVETLERERARCPGNGDVVINLAIGYWKQGNTAGALAAAIAALDADPTQSEWAEFLCIVARQSGLLT